MPLALGAPLAALPIALLLFLMLALRWSAARAGIAALLATLGLALGVFGYGEVVYGDIGRPRAVAGAMTEAGFSALTILWILFPALAIYHLQRRTGALDVLQAGIGRMAAEPPIIALLVAWFFALFLEGAAGFGTPIAITAPFLVSAGFRPVQAVTLALIGHAAGVSFGAVGTPIMAQVAATGFEPVVLSRATGVYVPLIGWILPIAMIALVLRGAAPERRTRAVWLWALVAAALFVGPYYVLARWVGPELPTLAGALIGGLAFVALWHFLARSEDQAPLPGEPVGGLALLRAGATYLLVVGLILLTRLITPIEEALRAPVWRWTLFERFGDSVQILHHPGTILLASFLLGAMVQRAPPRVIGAALASAARQIAPVSLALAAVLGVSRLLVHAGMIDLLATGAARVAGGAWPLLAPVVGAIGTAVTGSATASNILFTDLQQATATETGIPVVRGLGAQGFGAAAGNMIAPLNLLAGAAAVGVVGREGDILRKTVLLCLAYTLLGGALTWVLV